MTDDRPGFWITRYGKYRRIECRGVVCWQGWDSRGGWIALHPDIEARLETAYQQDQK